ncbi:MAG: hypothetical protein M3065_16440 [Actinomycetota bacterium]|nr:hypothetical protein [Actinomycetota bacterium]
MAERDGEVTPPDLHAFFSTSASVAGALIGLRLVRGTQPAELRNALFLAGLVVVFGLQLFYGLMVVLHPHDASYVDTLAILVFVCFIVGILRSWELIGGPSIRLRTEVRTIVRERGREGGEGPAGS